PAAAMIQFAVAIDGMGGGGAEPGGPVGVTFSPDGRALAVRSPDRQVRVYDVTSGNEIGQLQGHSGRIETVAFSRDSSLLASAGGDTTILLWDAAQALKNLAKPQLIELQPADVEDLWSSLAGEDAAKALSGVRKLAAAPRQTVAFLAERLKPVVRV